MVAGVLQGQYGAGRKVDGTAAEAAACAHYQAAGVDGRRAGVGVRPGQRQRARAFLGQRARAGNGAGKGAGSGLPEGQRALVGDVALQVARVAHQRGCRLDRGAAGVVVDAVECDWPGTGHVDAAHAGQVARQGVVGCPRCLQALGSQHDVVDKRLAAHVQGERAAVCMDLGGAQRAAVGKVGLATVQLRDTTAVQQCAFQVPRAAVDTQGVKVDVRAA
ncbi:hypothetical protein D3C72_716770 [compost metagenome]